MDVIAHVVILISAFKSKSGFSESTQLAEMPLLIVGVVEKVHAADAMWKQIQYSHGDESTVQSVALVVGAEKLGLSTELSRFLLQWGAAQEALEAGLRYIRRLLLVDVLLIVVEQVIFLRRESGRLQGHLKPVCRFWWLFDILEVAPEDFSSKVEVVLEACFLPADGQSRCRSRIQTTHSLVIGYSLAAAFVYSSPNT
jgi:hypothetical protein